MIHMLWSIVIGFVIGLIARAILPGADGMGFWATAILGILGSLAGGFIAGLVRKPPAGARFHPAGLLFSVIGAIVLLLVWRAIH